MVLTFVVLQGYISFAGAGEAEHVPHIEPSVATDKETYSRGSWAHITVKVVEEEEGHNTAEAEHNKADEGHDAEEAAHEREEGANDIEEAMVEEGVGVTVIIYDSEGNVFTSLVGATDHSGEADFEVYIGPEALTGIYSLVPKASVEGFPTVI